MAKMMQAIGVSGLLSPELLATAATRCSGCTDVEPCRDFLAGATLRGADHAPGFCPNASTFDALASEVPATF
jgi:hypothetical protein